MILPHLAKEKGREDVGQTHLPRALKISFGAFNILGHHAEIDLVRSEHMPDLPQHFLNAHIAASVPGAVVSREEQL